MQWLGYLAAAEAQVSHIRHSNTSSCGNAKAMAVQVLFQDLHP